MAPELGGQGKGGASAQLPDIANPFHLFVGEWDWLGKGVVIQTLEPCKRPVAYGCEHLDPVCIRMAGLHPGHCCHCIIDKGNRPMDHGEGVGCHHSIEMLLWGAFER